MSKFPRNSRVRHPSLSLAVLILASLGSAAVQIDFNKAGRQDAEVNEPGWVSWAVADVATESKTVGAVTFKLSMAGKGTSLTTDWYKAGIQSPSYARLVSDGVIVKDGTSGGAIQLEISGLSTGTHTLLAYHNGVDGNVWAEIDVAVDGVRKVTSLKPTNRVLTTEASAFSYLSFAATEGKAVTILYSPSATSSAASKNTILNGIALDLPNPKTQATAPSPADRDLHVDADAGTATLSWTTASGAKSHGLYFGTDSVSVANATPTSPSYKGALAATTWKASGLSPLETYWWRIDETGADGATTTGTLWSFAPRRLAFPGAEGYGRYARGGRGGKVVHVTNLNDAGAGSLREAVENDIGPRTIVFDVSGLLVLKSRLTLASDFVTVAGQTAPGKGICIRSAPFGFSGANDGIMRFVKIRLGYGATFDGTGLQGSDHCLFDHNTVSWTVDESFSSRSGKNITLQRTLIAEALNIADHQNYPAGTMHGYAATISGDVGSFHHNLLAHNDGRNWSLGGGLDAAGNYAGRLDIFDNVVYNWNDRATDGGAHEVNFVNNTYKPGPATSFKMALNAQWDGFPGTQQYYCQGNVVKGVKDDPNATRNGCQAESGNPSPWASKAFFPSYATVQTAAEAYKDVLSDVGATMPIFDDHDQRIVRETWTGTAKYKGSKSGLAGLPDRESDVGGYENYPSLTRPTDFDTDADGLPDWYEANLGTSPRSTPGDFSDANADPVGDGTTNLERYLEWMATPHVETKPDVPATFNLAALFRGYANGPTYKVGTNTCLTTSLKDSVLAVTPKSTCGIANLAVTATDKEGSSKTRAVAVFATGSASGTGVANRSALPLEWSIGANAVSLRTEEPGTLSLLDPSGRRIAQTSGTGELRLDLHHLPEGILVARYQGTNTQENRIVRRIP
jgi:hypothetical protein